MITDDVPHSGLLKDNYRLGLDATNGFQDHEAEAQGQLKPTTTTIMDIRHMAG